MLCDALRREFSAPSPSGLPVGQKGSYSETAQPAAPRWVWLLSTVWAVNPGMEQNKLREAEASTAFSASNFTEGKLLKEDGFFS